MEQTRTPPRVLPFLGTRIVDMMRKVGWDTRELQKALEHE